MSTHNQNPEQIARDNIDKMLAEAGWAVQSKKEVDLSASKGVAVREYQTDVGLADYVLFVDRKPVGIIEAKREEEGQHLTMVEEQSSEYASSKLKYLNNDPLPFVYESTGVLTRFTDYRDPKPRSRPVFHFHKPDTLLEWIGQEKTLRSRLQEIPELDETGLRPAQIKAIRNLETSFKENRPKALIQMATGAGKTFTACTFVYRLLKHADAKRILFVVDTKNLGEQAEQEFLKYQPTDDNRKFTELYNVQRLSSSYIASDSQVCISTIQRLYSILKGEELEEAAEEENPNEKTWEWQKKEPIPVEYNAKNPIEQFDFIIIDECHRSIYNLWKQVLDYYDAYLIGLTATPDKRTFGFFNENVVSEYTYEESVADGVNVPYDVFTIETEITQAGAKIKAKEYVDKREKLSRKKRWERLDEDYDYTANKLDKDVVNPSQIRHIIKAYKEALPNIFPDRFDESGEYEVPKTLVFAKTDSHADDIIQIIREEFGEGNDFCKKVTYKIEEDPKSVLNRFRNSWNPRIAVTVDMIATGTDVKPLEVLLFMRDVKSINYFEQMKGRGTRTINFDDLKRVTRTAKHTKTHFVIVDAVGATKSKKTDSRPLERKPTTPLKDLLGAVTMGVQDEDLYTSLANRLIRLEKQLTHDERAKYEELAGGKTLNQTTKDLLNAFDPDLIDSKSQALISKIPEEERTPAKEEECRRQAQNDLAVNAAKIFTGELNEYIDNVRKVHEQIIDTVNTDKILRSEWDSFTKDKAEEVVRNFRDYIESNKDEITALSIFYDQPYRRRELTFKMIKDLLTRLKLEKPLLAPHYVWEAYAQLENVKGNSPKNELVALVSLIRRITGIDQVLTPYDKSVDKNFQDWIFQKHSGAGQKFTEEQMQWLRMLKDHIASSFHIEVDDLDYTPFDAQGGRGRMYQLFGNRMDEIISELNEVLAA
ncbi:MULTISPECIES: type I restriction-modification enzyme R subunit C-terminal domain-containing protein [unclassified Robiginitalea]|uniref:type I restriction endonuclease subunit R n=2 Tax=Flavobacteriaceae TaxID=49546 RepID=UPI00234A9613|nr:MULTISPECIES: type I restriction-modification enzyme R subunit C-terminal domain-containing protein [unclassified Robiginitalea]MDC6353276.1 type I restriction-modification enzyme R subunit C-terminal domain-containing protein [Robiginitalea sp. PM2]MDC6373558.1 type I restriction-modification enzyme R subunit C-terminal domain-containing protein [Robiginitalea sp. SP8]